MERFVDEAEVAEMLNMKRSTVARLRRQENLPHVRIGKTIRYALDDVEKWFKQYAVNKQTEGLENEQKQ